MNLLKNKMTGKSPTMMNNVIIFTSLDCRRGGRQSPMSRGNSLVARLSIYNLHDWLAALHRRTKKENTLFFRPFNFHLFSFPASRLVVVISRLTGPITRNVHTL